MLCQRLLQSGFAVFSSLLLALSAALLACGGCASSKAAGGGALPDMKAVMADYEAGHFLQAYTGAVSLYRRSVVPERDEAAYLAGLSAYRLQRYEDADRYLSPLVRIASTDVAGRAAGTMGLVELERGRYREAAEYFKKAADRLEGQGKAEAAYRAGLAYKESNLHSLARVQFIIARGASSDAAFQAKVDRELKTSGYTLQLGVFSSRSNAEAVVREFQSSRAASIGEARIVTTEGSRGETLYYVHVGTFTSYSAAIRGRALLDQPAIVRPIEGAGE